MNSKRALIRVVNRILYAGGFVFLIVGLLLSALSTSVMAAGGSARGMLQETPQITPPNCYCPTVTPIVTNPTATNTGQPPQPSKTPGPTRPPMVLNLSNICGYTFDTFSLWKVANPGSTDVNYTWRVVDSSESGSGTVRANSDDYFTTSAGVTVRLYVGDQLVDTEECLAPCKQEIQLAYACVDDGLIWRASNPNSFGVSYTVRLDGQEAGRGTIPANGIANVATSTSGAHSLELTWTDTRPGTHTVSLNSSPASCPVVQTVTPTLTSSPLPQELTVTPTLTSTVTPTTDPGDPTATFTFTPTVTQTSLPDVIPSVTFTPTLTSTTPAGATFTFTPTVTPTTDPGDPTATFTFTPTVTQTALPDVIPSVTFTPTVTLTQVPSATSTPTPTQTLTPGPTFTSTFTPTTTLTALPGFVPSATLTSTVTPIGTLAPPVSTVTSTPVLIPVTGVDLTLPIGANSLSIFGSLMTNLGLFALGLALALTGISSQLKD